MEKIDADADKIKYWQYKLNQKQKNNEISKAKPRPSKVKTPEKTKKSTPIIAQDNFFTSTISKLKNLLEDNNTQRKKKETQPTHSTKNSKDIGVNKNPSYDLLKKFKKGESNLRTKASSTILLPKK